MAATPSLPFLALLCALVIPLSTTAGELRAGASLNPVGSINNTSSGASTSAYWPDPVTPKAGATATRTQLTAFTDGAGVAPPQIYGASALAGNDYTLWDTAGNTNLDYATAITLTLSFNFRVTGSLSVDPVSLSTGATSYNAQLFSQVANTAGAFVNVVYGPVPPFPSEDYFTTGDAGLFGAYDRSFSLLHQAREYGLLNMDYGNSASNAARASGSLTLQSVTLVGGVMPAGGMSIRLVDSGQLFAVSAVPEPATGLLWLAGVAVLAGLARRRSSQQRL